MKITQLNAEQVAALETGKILRYKKDNLQICVTDLPELAVWYKFGDQAWTRLTNAVDISLMFHADGFEVVEPEVKP